MCVFDEAQAEKTCGDAGCLWPSEPCQRLWPRKETEMPSLGRVIMKHVRQWEGCGHITMGQLEALAVELDREQRHREMAADAIDPQPKPKYDLYVDAVNEGLKIYREHASKGIGIEVKLTHAQKEPLGDSHQKPTLPIHGPQGPGYWIAWWAARRATGALLDKAREIGVTEEQWEELRKVAATVAYD